MPGNVIHDILSQLPKHDRVSMSLTCSTIYTADKTFVGHDLCIVPYLWQMSSYLPDVWLCALCHRLHRMAELDTPNAPVPQVCRRRHASMFKKPLRYDGVIIRGDDDKVVYNLGYRHIQSALKWLRLGIHENHARRLLSGHRSSHTIWHGAKRCRTSVIALPKVVGAGGKRCLLIKAFRYRLVEPVPRPYWEINICPHQTYTEYQYRTYFSETGPMSRNGLLPNFAICKAVKSAIASPGHDIFSSCALCRTDFCVKMVTQDDSPDSWRRPGANSSDIHGAYVMVWQDLGGECSPVQAAWTSQSSPTSELARRAQFRYKKPGSVWRAFLVNVDGTHNETICKISKIYKDLTDEIKLLGQQQQQQQPHGIEFLPMLYTKFDCSDK
ncbi:hypothetical protein E4U21_001819 [Claviceps maximensis]|nr:hypothetical protein E4U21_001819 [Claviceps maximensis]